MSEQAAVVVPVLVLVPRETSLHPRLSSVRLAIRSFSDSKILT